MNKTKEDVVSWLYENDFSRLDVSIILGLNVISFKQETNILDVEFEMFVFEPTNSKEFGLFEIPRGSWAEYFPAGLLYEREKNKYVFESENNCANLTNDDGYRDLDSPYDSVSKLYLWEDENIPEKVIAEIFDYNTIGSAGVQIIEQFELYEKNAVIPECIPKRLIPHLLKAIADYPVV